MPVDDAPHLLGGHGLQKRAVAGGILVELGVGGGGGGAVGGDDVQFAGDVRHDHAQADDGGGGVGDRAGDLAGGQRDVAVLAALLHAGVTVQAVDVVAAVVERLKAVVLAGHHELAVQVDQAVLAVLFHAGVAVQVVFVDIIVLAAGHEHIAFQVGDAVVVVFIVDGQAAGAQVGAEAVAGHDHLARGQVDHALVVGGIGIVEGFGVAHGGKRGIIDGHHAVAVLDEEIVAVGLGAVDVLAAQRARHGGAFKVVEVVGGDDVVLVAEERLVVVGLGVGHFELHGHGPLLGEEFDIAVLHGHHQFARGVERAEHVGAVLVLHGVVAANAVVADAAVFAGDDGVALDVEHALQAGVAGVDDAGAVVLKIGVGAEIARGDEGDARAALGKGRQAQRQRQQQNQQFFHGGLLLSMIFRTYHTAPAQRACWRGVYGALNLSPSPRPPPCTDRRRRRRSGRRGSGRRRRTTCGTCASPAPG